MMRPGAMGLVVLMAACTAGSGTGTGSVPPDTVVIRDFSFNPSQLTVPIGTEVTWSNQETGTTHTSTAEDGVWDSGSIPPGEFFEFTFEEAGTFRYFCSIHGRMTGTVVVEG